MKLLITLTEHKTNEDIAVNPSRIVSVKPMTDHRFLVMDNGETFEVIETVRGIESKANA